MTEIHDGLEYVIRHPLLGALLGLVAAVHFAIDAPVFVGVTALAAKRFVGAENLGLMLSAWGGGALLGALIAGVMRVKNRGRIVLGLAALLGVLFITLGFLPTLYSVTLDLAIMGLANGFWSVLGIAWVQKVVPDEFLRTRHERGNARLGWHCAFLVRPCWLTRRCQFDSYVHERRRNHPVDRYFRSP